MFCRMASSNDMLGLRFCEKLLLHFNLVDGGWCDWSNYTECRASDTGGFKLKTRECKCPTPENGGQPCTGIYLKHECYHYFEAFIIKDVLFTENALVYQG